MSVRITRARPKNCPRRSCLNVVLNVHPTPFLKVLLSTVQLSEGSADCPRRNCLNVVLNVHPTPFLKVLLTAHGPTV
jgi:hypothetical protein